MIICCYESRASCETGLRLLIASVYRHSPDIEMHIYFPPATQEFCSWTRGFNNVRLVSKTFSESLHWNVKPDVILNEFKNYEEDILWLNSDVIIAGPLEPLFENLDGETLVIAEEALWGAHDDGKAMRAKLWNLSVGREFHFCLNTCALRLTVHHRALVECWKQKLDSADYRRAQTMRFDLRPQHMAGDQDVLTALLCSTTFAHVPVRVLRRGSDILQVFGLKAFTTVERVRSLTGLPPIIHSQGAKPWLPRQMPVTMMEHLEAAYLDTSPYSLVALEFAIDTSAFSAKTTCGYWLRAAGLGSPSLAGFPFALLFDVAYGVARFVKLTLLKKNTHNDYV